MSQDFINAALQRFKKLRERFEKESPDRAELFWRDSPDAPLGDQLKCQIAFHLATTLRGVGVEDFARAAISQQAKLSPDDIPRRSRGLGVDEGPVGYFKLETYVGWLKATGKTVPANPYSEACVECVLRASDEYLRPRDLKPGKSIYETLLNFRGDARFALKTCLDLLYHVPGAIDYRYVKPSILGVMPTGTELGLTSQKKFTAHYRNLLDALRKHRSVQVVGPSYSGKHTLLRKVVNSHVKEGFTTASGARLTMCVLSLHEHQPAEAIEYIAKFYRSALGVERMGGTVSELVSEIAHFSKQFPALIVLAGLDAIDSNEILRAMHQDVIGDIVSHILDGHPETRLLVSSSVTGNAELGQMARAFLPFDRCIDLADALVPAENYEYRALLQCAQALCRERLNCDQHQLVQELGDLWMSDDDLRSGAVRADALERLGRYICETMLDGVERCCLGLVALSHDGLKPTTISAIVEGLRGGSRKPDRWNFAPVEVLRTLPSEVVRHPSKARATGLQCYQIERALRISILRTWEDQAPDQFRDACWGIARAAAGEARVLRASSGIESSAGRDVQVLIFLLSAVNVGELGNETIREPFEHIVLPPLSICDAKMPSSRDIIEFSFSTLFEGDLARTAAGGASILSDARLRLAAVRPFINNRTPWLTMASENVSSHWRPQAGHAPWVALPLEAKLRLILFASAAAVRLNLSRVITACARLAEELVEGQTLTGGELSTLIRVQLYELDFAILLGRNPDTPGLWAHGNRGDEPTALEQIVERLKKLAQQLKPFERNAVYATEKAKLDARLGEVLHLSGLHGQAYLAFVAAAGDRSSLVRRGSVRLRGRSRRMFTRLLVETARAQLFGPLTVNPVRYRDGLELPVFHRVTERPSRLIQAEQVVAESLRGLTLGSTNDWIGAKIDVARLAAVQLHYAEALQVLDQARPLTRVAGASRDIVLEYLSVQGRAFTDAASFAMSVGGIEHGPLRSMYGRDLAELGRYLGMTTAADGVSLDWRQAVAISNELCNHASRTLDELRCMVLLPDRQGTRYAIYADYLDVWLSVVRSRQTIDVATEEQVEVQVYTQLYEAGAKFERVLASMMRAGYLLARREAKLLYEGFVSAGVPVAVPEGFPGIVPYGTLPRQQASGSPDKTPE